MANSPNVEVIGYVDIDNSNVVFPKEMPTYEQYVDLVNKVSQSAIHFQCSSKSTSAGHVNDIYMKRFNIDLSSYYIQLANTSGKLFHYTGD